MNETRFKPRIISITDGGPKDRNVIRVYIRGGDKRKTNIYCECSVRNEIMVIDRIKFSQPARPVQDHSSRAEVVDSIEDILTGWLKTHDGTRLDTVLKEWTSKKESVRKIGTIWNVKSGDHEYRNDEKMDSIGFLVNLHPSVHFNYPRRF